MVARVARLIAILTPGQRRLERAVRPRWPDLFSTARRATGTAMLLVGLSMISPVRSATSPPPIIMVLALAYLEEDRLVLLIALGGAMGALAVTAATAMVETIDWIDLAVHRARS
jgi:hypothetical protein